MSADDDESFRTYAMDADEALRDIESSLLSLERAPDSSDEINRLYRALHTVKGNSALLGLLSIEALAHAAEDMVGLARERVVSVDATMTEVMLQVVDRLKAMVEQAGHDRRDQPDDGAAELVSRIHAFTRKHGKKPVPVGATRGEILIWGDDASAATEATQAAPTSVDGGEDVDDAVEFFLAQCREELPCLLTEVAPARLAAGAVDGQIVALLIGELTPAALRLGYFELVDDLGILERLLREGKPAASDAMAPLLRVTRELVRLEQRWVAAEPGRPDFGLAALCREALGEASAAPSTVPAPVIDLDARDSTQTPEIAESQRPAAPMRPPPPPTPPSSAPGKRARSDGEFLRIDARKLSLVLDLAGEIALASGAVTHHPEIEQLELEGFSAAAHKLEVLIRELQNEVSAMRLVPVAGVFSRMQRVVRDTARRTGKQVALTLVGEDTEIDKVMFDSLHDPLVHIVRNAVDHGIELPDERVAKGKSPVGSLVLEASHQGGEVNVQVRDDGRGLDRARIRQKAIERGLIEASAPLDDPRLLDLVFLPGFSTKQEVSELSGRGVGMDVLKTTIEGLRGRVQIESKEGRGSTIHMTVPLTLAFVEAMVVRARERLFALPIEKVSEVFKVERAQLSRNSADASTTLRVRNRLIPLLWLHRFYGERASDDDQVEGKVVVVVQNSRGSVALPVDALLGNQPVMLKPMRGPLANVRAAAGCGMLRSGDVALALDCERLPV
ncbi:MAG: chemotaxis protein CheA [Polyangiales bacterium]